MLVFVFHFVTESVIVSTPPHTSHSNCFSAEHLAGPSLPNAQHMYDMRLSDVFSNAHPHIPPYPPPSESLFHFELSGPPPGGVSSLLSSSGRPSSAPSSPHHFMTSPLTSAALTPPSQGEHIVTSLLCCSLVT